jgi:hypothetical protein
VSSMHLPQLIRRCWAQAQVSTGIVHARSPTEHWTVASCLNDWFQTLQKRDGWWYDRCRERGAGTTGPIMHCAAATRERSISPAVSRPSENFTCHSDQPLDPAPPLG